MTKVERDRGAEDLVFDLVLAGLDPLGDFDFLLAREQLEVAHLLQVEANRIGRFGERIGDHRGLGGLLGLLLGLDRIVIVAVGGRHFVEDLDVHVLEAFERRPQVGGRGDVLRQEVVDLVESQVTLLTPEIDETL